MFFFVRDKKKKKKKRFSLNCTDKILIFPDVSILITVRIYINNSDLNKN